MELERRADWRLKIPERVLLALPDLNGVCEEIVRTHPTLSVEDDPITGTETWVGEYPADGEDRAEAVASLAPVVEALKASRVSPYPKAEEPE